MKTVSHLGCTLDSENSIKNDIGIKRGKFIGKVNSLLQEFHFVSKEVLMKLINTYTTSFYGSPTWDMYSTSCEKLFKSWNVTMRNVLAVDRQTHRYLVELLSNQQHPKVMLATRLVRFYRAQLDSPKFRVRFLVRLAENDMRTVLGRSLDSIAKECNHDVETLTPYLVKSKLRYAAVPIGQEWKLPLVTELYSLKCNEKSLPGFTYDEIDAMLQYICIT